MYTELLTEEQIKQFQEETRLTIKDAGTGKISHVKFKIFANGKMYLPHNGYEGNLSIEELSDLTFTFYFYDFGCGIKLPNYDPNYIRVEEVKLKYRAFMEAAMKDLGKLTEYKRARKQAKIMAEKTREEAFRM